MLTNPITLLVLSVLPIIILLFYIYKRDKYEKEPLPLLLICFVAGGIIVIFGVIIVVSPLISIFKIENNSLIGSFIHAFGFAAIPEEVFKFLVLYVIIWRNKHFNEYFDGIVYAVFVSLGFACTENILYVFNHGFNTGIVRAFLSVPGHFLFGVMMGYFFALAKFNPEKRIRYLLLSLLIPIICHGVFNFLLLSIDLSEEILIGFLILLFLALDIILWIVAIKRIKSHSNNSIFKI